MWFNMVDVWFPAKHSFYYFHGIQWFSYTKQNAMPQKTIGKKIIKVFVETISVLKNKIVKWECTKNTSP